MKLVVVSQISLLEACPIEGSDTVAQQPHFGTSSHEWMELTPLNNAQALILLTSRWWWTENVVRYYYR